MKARTITIKLDRNLDWLLTEESRRSGMRRSAVARDSLRRGLRICQFEASRQRIRPCAKARGYSTDGDVFSDVS